MEIEKEVKIILSEKEYHNILNNVHIVKNINQVNHFFDTTNFNLYNKKSAFRIREQDGNIIMTLKAQKHRDNGVTVSEEYNEYLDDFKRGDLRFCCKVEFIV
ncbi:CYTH domain-containing protein [Mammaliicoccus vitulinus]|uniref:CYTH domain-containing protein n=1 Tax=Mammaliicoccus vitulinus TaxID=71237 RepID=UPI000D1F2571|nr:CYTH domain-containing protein [Mammaliicoccus vitulinus]PTI68601.1 hypothetical protein BU073_13005 [Mammaliicoccus vitulinus]